MEASAAFHRCVWQAFTRPAHCRHVNASANLFSRSTQQSITRISSRPLTSTSRSLRNDPPQPQPVSQEKSNLDAVGATSMQPETQTRIDLSTLKGIPSSYVPPKDADGNSVPSTRPGSAGAKIDALFGRSQRNKTTAENPFQKTIRQTDARNNPPPKQFDNSAVSFASLFAEIESAPSSRPSMPNADSKLPLRLRPTLGRTQSVDNGRGLDLTRAFRLLEMKCTQNSVRRDMVKQKFHVRRGQRRKLERSLRWRTAFKAGFLEECARVRRMKNQGW